MNVHDYSLSPLFNCDAGAANLQASLTPKKQNPERCPGVVRVLCKYSGALTLHRKALIFGCLASKLLHDSVPRYTSSDNRAAAAVFRRFSAIHAETHDLWS